MNDAAQSGSHSRLPVWMVILCVIVVISAVAAPIGVPYYREQRAIAYIETVGGQIAKKKGGPVWMRRLVGHKPMQVFDRVFEVRLNESGVTDEGLAHLSGLTNLKWLNLGGTGITDAGLAHLCGLTNLENLALIDTGVVDAGLAHLRGLTKVKYLALIGTGITDAGLIHLDGLTNLNELSLARTGITNAGLAHLTGLTKLVELDLRGTGVTADGVKVIETTLPGLRFIFHESLGD